MKYMGFSYVCLIPILSWLLVFNTAEIYRSFAIPLDRVFHSPLLLIFKSLLIVLALTLLVGSLSLNSRFSRGTLSLRLRPTILTSSTMNI